MSNITRTVHINSQPEKVLEYIADVNHHPAFLSALKSVDNISGASETVGTSWDWSFIMAGVELQGRAETADYQAGKLYSFKTSNGADSTFMYEVAPENDGTLLTITVDYELPESVLTKVADKSVIEKYNEDEADRVGENLRAILEV